MSEIPAFDDAVVEFERFLAAQGHSGVVSWVFREDVWRRSPSRIVVRRPPRSGSHDLARKVYAEGRAKGLVSVDALARVNSGVIATVWYPRLTGEEVQGWSRGLRLSISEPLPTASEFPGLAWRMLGLFPAYRRYQAHECFVGTRNWAAAEQ
jgi:hypothetical protein